MGRQHGNSWLTNISLIPITSICYYLCCNTYEKVERSEKHDMYISTSMCCRAGNYLPSRVATPPDTQGMLPTCMSPWICHAPAGDEEIQQGHGSQEGANGPNPLDNFG